MTPDFEPADIAAMQEQSEKLLEILRSASADLPPGAARDIVDSLASMLTDSTREFFPAAHAMYDDLQQLKASRPAAGPKPTEDPTATKDELGRRLRDELLRAFPEDDKSPKSKEETSFTEGSLWRAFE